jgi:SAM-dependent methyltransferase
MNPAEFANIARSEQRFWWYRGMNLILFRMLDEIAGKRRFSRVLEAGCGTGYLAKLLAERYGWSLFPVDLGWEGLEYAQSMDVPRLAQADIAKLPFADASFDAVLSMDVIVHFPLGEEHRPMRELVRVLAPGGLLAIRVSALDVLRSRHSEFAHERQRFTRGRLMELASSCGIEVERCTYANSMLMPVALAKFRVWEPLMAPAPASGVTPVHPVLDRLLFSALRFEAAWLGAGYGFPAGQSLLLLGWKRGGPS